MNTVKFILNADGSGEIDGWAFNYIAGNSTQYFPSEEGTHEVESEGWFIQSGVLKHD